MYTGQEYDADVGLYYYNARWYDPKTARFLSEDPLGFAAGDLNVTRYVGNDAVNATDPTGLAILHEGDIDPGTDLPGNFAPLPGPLDPTSPGYGGGFGGPITPAGGGLQIGPTDTIRGIGGDLPTDLGPPLVYIPPFDPRDPGLSGGSFVPSSAGMGGDFDPTGPFVVSVEYIESSADWYWRGVDEQYQEFWYEANTLQHAVGWLTCPRHVVTGFFRSSARTIFPPSEPDVKVNYSDGTYIIYLGGGPSGADLAGQAGMFFPFLPRGARVPSKPPAGGSPAAGLPEVPAARGGPYGHLNDHPSVNSGKPFTPSQKKKILAENKAANNGQLRDDVTGEPLLPPRKHQRGVTPPHNEANVDHVYPRSKGGPNSFSNAEVRSRCSNIKKGDKLE